MLLATLPLAQGWPLLAFYGQIKNLTALHTQLTQWEIAADPSMGDRDVAARIADPVALQAEWARLVNVLESDALALLDEIERVLQIGAVLMNWPIGSGPSFQGIYDLQQRKVLLFERITQGQHRAPVQSAALNDLRLDNLLGSRVC
jgi:hypothetical protein